MHIGVVIPKRKCAIDLVHIKLYNKLIMNPNLQAEHGFVDGQQMVVHMINNGDIDTAVRKASVVHGWQESGLVGREDVAQETAWRMYDHADQIMRNEKGSPLGYAYRVASNLMIDTHRRESARPQTDAVTSRRLNAPETLPVQPREVLPSVLDSADQVGDNMLVQELLSQLSEDHRAAIVSVHLRGLSVADAAAELGVVGGTVKSRIHYGMRQLRKILQDQGIDSFADL